MRRYQIMFQSRVKRLTAATIAIEEVLRTGPVSPARVALLTVRISARAILASEPEYAVVERPRKAKPRARK